MSDQEENDRKAALTSFTDDIGNRIFQGYEKTESLFSSARILKVPPDLRKLNPSAYTPRLIAIGPFHWDEPHLQTMQHVKMYYANYLFFRLTKGIEDQGKRGEKKFELLQQCVEKMKKSVERAKKCYAEEIKVKNDDVMAEMMLIDGCFILELLCCYHDAGKSTTNGGDGCNSKASSSGDQEQKADPIIDNPLTANLVKRDLRLLENQIPYFVLKKLFKLTVDKIPMDQVIGEKKLSLTKYVISYFEDVHVMFPPGDCVLSISWKADEYLHILHLLHSRCLPVPGGQMEKKKHSEIKLSDLRISASDLDYAGVKLEGKKGSLFNIRFEGGKFEIPIIRVHGFTEAILRNLIAFEQCCPGVSQHYYAMFMDMLINHEKDIQVLKDAKVIDNYLGTNKDVSDLFNNLCKEIVTEDFYFSEACVQASDFTKRNCCPMFYAYLKRTYFGSPWGFIGFFLAFVAFAMQVIQFIYDFFK